MKIGIMSMQRVRNYGSFLQAYGLKKTIEALGHEVVFVDYRFEKELVHNERSLYQKIVNNLNVFKYLKKKQTQKKYDERFDNEFLPFLCGKKKNYVPKDIELLVIGSDEVFNCLQPYPVGYSRELFGKGYENIPVISYAACFGQTNYDRLKEYGISEEVSELLKKFKAISVRDDNSYETVKKLTGIEATMNLDPVLVSDFSDEMIDNVEIKDYIVVYAYPERLTAEEKKEIKKFAKKHNKMIVSFGMFQDISDMEIVVNPFEIFAYFKHADFIITDTFHGSIFSIKTHSNFCAVVRGNTIGNSNKLADLLGRLEISGCILSDIHELEDRYLGKIDYDEADKIMAQEKANTNTFLKRNLKSEKE